MLAVLCQVFVAGVAIFRLATLGASRRRHWDEFVEVGKPFFLPVAFAVALVTISGSLYFQFGAHFDPCNLCWIQRAFLYPQVLLMAILLFKPNLTAVKGIAIALCVADIPVSIYHYLIEWFPNLHSAVCDPKNPCSSIWFRDLGYVTLALMALSSALTIITLMLLSGLRRNRT